MMNGIDYFHLLEEIIKSSGMRRLLGKIEEGMGESFHVEDPKLKLLLRDELLTRVVVDSILLSEVAHLKDLERREILKGVFRKRAGYYI